MANDLNQCNFIGRLGRDLETRTFPSGDSVANGTLAVGSKWKSKSGELCENTEWIRLVFPGKLAEIASQYLRKGSQIHVSCECRTRKYQKDGVEQYATEFRVINMQMLGGKQDGQQSQAPQQRQQPQRQAAPAPRSTSGFDSNDSEDIPW